MEHSDAQALLELATVEPAGFERLVAGDTAESAALAGHLAGCPVCAAEFERLGVLAPELRAAIRELPPVDLRERTLALVASVGRSRSAAVPASLDVPLSGEGMAPAVEPPKRRPASRSWALATAAALLIAIAGVAGWWNASSDLERGQAATAKLAGVTAATARIASQPDAQSVELAATTTGAAEPARGKVLISASTQELVVLAEGLSEPPAGTEYRCWVEVGTSRTAIGKMYLYAGLATWAGWSSALEGIGPGTTLGVSLGEVGGDPIGEPLLTGAL